MADRTSPAIPITIEMMASVESSCWLTLVDWRTVEEFEKGVLVVIAASVKVSGIIITG